MFDPVTLALALGALTLVGTAAKFRTSGPLPNTLPRTPEYDTLKNEVLSRVQDASKITIPSIDRFVEVKLGDQTYLVAPHYIAPVGIGEGEQIAKANGFELPTPELVDAIWQAADLKLEPLPRGPSDKPPSDYTARTMNSPETNVAQLARISRQVEETNPDYHLLAGTHKDIVLGKTPTGETKLGIYGWHRPNGSKIQGFMWGHAPEWKDYSQGLRLVRKV